MTGEPTFTGGSVSAGAKVFVRAFVNRLLMHSQAIPGFEPLVAEGAFMVVARLVFFDKVIGEELVVRRLEVAGVEVASEDGCTSSLMSLEQVAVVVLFATVVAPVPTNHV